MEPQTGKLSRVNKRTSYQSLGRVKGNQGWCCFLCWKHQGEEAELGPESIALGSDCQVAAEGSAQAICKLQRLGEEGAQGEKKAALTLFSMPQE